MLDYKLVEAFGVVATEGGFEKAAKVLHLTQSAISQRVKLLEEQVGAILLVRSTPPEPTAAGREMLKHYRQVRQLEEDLGPGLSREAEGFATLPVGLNADSLATWFFPAVNGYLDSTNVLLDICTDDQAQTHQLLRNGEVLGCISARSKPVQGCRVEYLGDMVYRLYSSVNYREKWFKNGMELGALEKAPVLIFNRKDTIHDELLMEVLGEVPTKYNGFYLPDSEQFPPAIAAGRGCGMAPEQQAAEYVERGELVNLCPGHTYPVRLYWHCWNLESSVLSDFTDALVAGAREALVQNP